MTDNPKARWPKTLDGTIDWEAVFEDPNIGLIPLVLQSPNTDTLRRTAEVVLQKLFTRRNDTDARTILMARLSDIIATGGELEDVKTQVVALLRTVKDERIERARLYVERKRAGAAIDRRSGLFWKIDALLRPALLIPIGGVLVAVLAMVVYIVLDSIVRPPVAGIAADGPAVTQTEAPGQIPAEAPVSREPQPIPIWLKTVRWPVSPDEKGGDRPQFYAVIPHVMHWREQEEFCHRLPNVMDQIYLVFDELMPKDRPPRIDEIITIEEELRKAFNDTMPEDFVVKVVLARYGTPEFKVSTLPPFCKSPKTRPTQ